MMDTSRKTTPKQGLLAANEDVRLIENGWEPVAVAGKAALGNVWSSRPNTTEAVAQERAALPHATSTGLRTGRLVGLDVDLVPPDHIAAVDKLAREVLGDTFFERRGAKGTMLCYRNAAPLSKITISGKHPDQCKPAKVEVLGNGQQFVAYGKHPGTGKPYEWVHAYRDAEPLCAPFGTVPEVTADQLREFARRAAEVMESLGYEGVAVSDPGDPARRAAYEAKRCEEKVPVAEAELIEVLGYVKPDCDRNPWIGALGGIRATNLRDTPADEMDARLCEIAVAWSRGDYASERPRNFAGEEDAEAAFYSLDPTRENGTTFGTLYYRASKNGYDKPPPGKTAEEIFGPPEKWAAAFQETQAPKATGATGRGVRIISGASMIPKKIEWLWPGWLARGKFHVLAGAKGAGKSTLTFDLFAALTAGGKWPDGTPAPRGDVLIWSAEDDFNDTILPRFMVAGGDRSRLHYVQHVIEPDGTKQHFDPAVHMPDLLAAAQRLPDLAAVMLDPVVSAVPVGSDSHKNAEARRGLQPLVDFAAERRIAVLGITHFTKNTQGREPIERVTGSLAFGALPRVVWGAVKGNDEDAERRLVRIASNIGPAGGGIEYLLRQEPVPGYDFSAQRIMWGKWLTGSARELLDEGQEKRSELAKAVEFLTSMLREHGSAGVFVSELMEAAKAQTLAWRTVQRAKEKMGRVRAKARPGSTPPKWVWYLEPQGDVGGL